MTVTSRGGFVSHSWHIKAFEMLEHPCLTLSDVKLQIKTSPRPKKSTMAHFRAKFELSCATDSHLTLM